MSITLADLQRIGEASKPLPRPDYTHTLLELSVIETRLEAQLKEMRKRSTGAISETQNRMHLGKAIGLIRRAARELNA